MFKYYKPLSKDVQTILKKMTDRYLKLNIINSDSYQLTNPNKISNNYLYILCFFAGYQFRYLVNYLFMS